MHKSYAKENYSGNLMQDYFGSNEKTYICNSDFSSEKNLKVTNYCNDASRTLPFVKHVASDPEIQSAESKNLQESIPLYRSFSENAVSCSIDLQDSYFCKGYLDMLLKTNSEKYQNKQDLTKTSVTSPKIVGVVEKQVDTYHQDSGEVEFSSRKVSKNKYSTFSNLANTQESEAINYNSSTSDENFVNFCSLKMCDGTCEKIKTQKSKSVENILNSGPISFFPITSNTKCYK